MKHKITLILGLIGIIILSLYFFQINSIAKSRYTHTNNQLNQDPISISHGTDIQLGIGDEVDVAVKRPRWYGTINEYHKGKNTISILTTMIFINIPLSVNNNNLIPLHLIITGSIIFIILITFFIELIIRMERGEYHARFDNWD